MNLSPIKIAILIFLGIINGTALMHGQKLESFEVTADWKNKINQLAPEGVQDAPVQKPKILLFSVSTGFYHWVIPHTDEVIKILAEKTGVFNVQQSNDINVFQKNELAKYDAIILNNNCPERPRRNIFYDMLESDSNISENKKLQLAAGYEENLFDFVEKGGGLMAIHGGIIFLNENMKFSKMLGGSFDYHPKQQKIEVMPVDPDHPMVRAFNGEPLIHIDEPYLFKNAYHDYHFRPLLWMDASELEGLKKPLKKNVQYVSWIKRFGEGRVFYVSPSHNAQSFEDPRLLKYYLDGIMYVTGNLECDDSPLQNHQNQ